MITSTTNCASVDVFTLTGAVLANRRIWAYYTKVFSLGPPFEWPYMGQRLITIKVALQLEEVKLNKVLGSTTLSV